MNPLLGLCPEFVRHGWRISCSTDDLHQELVRLAGAQPVPFALPKGEDAAELASLRTLPPSHPRWWELYAEFVYPWLLEVAAATVQQLTGFFRANRPDIVLYDEIAFAGRILAQRFDIPAIKTGACFAHHKWLYWQDGVGRDPPPLLRFGEQLDAFLRSHGIDSTTGLRHAEERNMYFIPAEIQYESDSLDGRFCFLGPCLNRPFIRSWKNNSGGKPIILVSDMVGSDDPAYFKKLAEALRGTDYHVILSVGNELAAGSLGPLPEGFEINRNASHLEILPHAALLICQGGSGSAFEAMHHGVPVLALPLNPSHEEFTYRLAELGACIRLPRREVTIDMIQDGVEALLHDSALRAAVQRMRRVLPACGGAAMAADIIGQLLPPQSPGVQFVSEQPEVTGRSD